MQLLRSTNRPNRRGGFSLIEMLAVLMIASVLSVLATQSLAGIDGAGNFTDCLNTISGRIEEARVCALARNTYVYVGFFGSSTPMQMVLSVVASADGTKIYADTAPTGWTPDSSHLVEICKPQVLRNIRLQGPGDAPLTLAQPPSDAFLTTTTVSSPFSFTFPLTSPTATYTFNQVIQITPRGSVAFLLPAPGNPTPNVTSPHYLEMDLYQSNGSISRPTSTRGEAAIQIDGQSGIVRTFRP